MSQSLQQAADLSLSSAIAALQEAAMANCKLGDIDQAVKLAKICVNLEPTNAHWLNNLAYFLTSTLTTFKPKEALLAVENALLLSKEPGLNYNRGVILSAMQRVDEAIDSYRAELITDPTNYRASFNLGCMLMFNGQYREALIRLEDRFKYSADIIATRSCFPKPDWAGQSGCRLLVYSEQGIGDVIQYIRYLPQIPCTLLGEIPEGLIPLLKDFFVAGDEEMIGNGEYDYVVSFASLPYLLDPDLTNIPKAPYLFTDTERLPGIGLCWAGNPKHRNDASRSIPVEKLLSIKYPAQLYSLQKGKSADSVIDLPLPDFLATAKLISSLDLVITVDTAVAHLAGALDKPTWLLLSFVHDHRWSLTGNTTHWYESIRIFKQKKMGDWDEVINEIELELPKFFNSCTGSSFLCWRERQT